jgi:hypothetical protein
MQMLASPALAVSSKISECTITGTAGADILTGTNGKDVICGLGGNDLIQGGSGNDLIYAGAGNDKILGGDGNDTIFGQGQGDFISGQAGNDKLDGGDGSDMLSGGAGRDTLIVNQGQDTCGWDRLDVMKGNCKLDKKSPFISAIGPTVQKVQAGATAYFRWRTTDSSGIEDSWLNIGGASGWVTKWCGFVVASQRVDGTPKDGTYLAKCDIPKTAPNLVYSVFLTSRDKMGNVATSDSAITFEVFGGSQDITAPSFEPVSVPLRIEPGSSFEVTWRSTDETDVAYSALYFLPVDASFNNGFVTYISAQGGSTLLAGDEKDGVYSQTFFVNPDTPDAVFTMWATLSDSLGNKFFESTSESVEVKK